MKAAFIGAILIAYGTAVFASMITKQVVDSCWRDQLTKSGHAEYFLDAANQRQWRMKETK